MALHRRISKAAKTLRRPVRPLAAVGAVAAGAMALGLAIAGPASASTGAALSGTGQPIVFGTLDTQTNTAAQGAKGGVPMAMFEFNWASFEPTKGVVSASYLATMKSFLQAYQAAGMKVTLGLGTQNPPSWVFSLPNSTYVDQNGNTSNEADFVYSQAARQAAATYFGLVAANLPLSNFWAIRLTSGGNPEMLYPGGNTYWAFNNAALTGRGLAAGMTRNPYPTWRPGQPGLTQAQTDRRATWHVARL